MAIIQISSIKQRSGNLVDLPQLDEAQFGWANDQKQLFIGTSTPNPNENVEVLTSYSNITFSQINGSQGNLNISAATNGEILSYDGTNWINKGGSAGGTINLGTVANVKIGGGAIGYVLETDGVGNLSWSPKSTITAYISAITKANPGVVTTTPDNFFTDGSLVTITDIIGMVELNGNSFYVNVLTSNTFALYSDSGLSTPVDTSAYTTYSSGGRVISSVGDSGTSAAGGTNTSVQFNFNNILTGNAGFTFDKTTGILTSPFLAGAGNGLSNIQGANVSGTVANATYAVSAGTAGTVTNGFYTTSNIILGTTTIAANRTSASQSLTGISIDGSAGSATTAGTVTTAAQPNITSVGTLTSLTVTGNITSGNADLGNAATANFFLGNGSLLTGVTSSSANTAATVTANAQANITSVGTLAGATIDNTLQAHILQCNSFSTTGQNNFFGPASGTDTGDTYIELRGRSDYPRLDKFRIIMTPKNGSPLYGSTLTLSDLTGAGVQTTRLTIDSDGTVTVPGTFQSTTLTTGANTTAGTITGNWALSAGSQLNSTYADLAEYYEADRQYEPGTVLAFGGDKEVTLAEAGTNRVAGIVSTNPAYVMNMKCKGAYIIALALQGRAPVKVKGNVKKGDMLISCGDGYAKAVPFPVMGSVIGKSLENFEGVDGIIEVAVGRL